MGDIAGRAGRGAPATESSTQEAPPTLQDGHTSRMDDAWYLNRRGKVAIISWNLVLDSCIHSWRARG